MHILIIAIELPDGHFKLRVNEVDIDKLGSRLTTTCIPWNDEEKHFLVEKARAGAEQKICLLFSRGEQLRT